MGRIVKCPRCEWRGFVPYYFFHWQKNHESEGYLPAEKVDLEGMDSRPISEVSNHSEERAHEVNVHHAPRVHRAPSSSSKKN